MSYTLLKHLHVTTVAITLALFVLRGALALAGSPRWRTPWLRLLPHVNDTFLLAAAIALVVPSWGNPLAQPWLLAKILGLLTYILLGHQALKPLQPKPRRVFYLALSLACFGYIVAVALTKQAWPLPS